MTIGVLLAVFMVTNTAGVLLLRTSLKDGGSGVGGILGQVRNPFFLVGVLSYGVSFVTWLLGLQRFRVSVVYPVFVGAGYAAVILASLVFLKEEPSLLHLIGIAIIGVGILLVVT